MILSSFLKNYGLEIIISSIFVLIAIGLFICLIVNLERNNGSRKLKAIGGTIFLLVLVSVNYVMLSDYKSELAKDPTFTFPISKFLIFNAYIIFLFAVVGFFLTTKSKQKQKITVATVATLGLMTALASVLMLFGIPIFPSAPYLKVELSAFVYFMVFLWFGVKPAIIVIFITNLLHAIMPSMTPPQILFLDELVNVVACLAYLTPSFIAYHNRNNEELKLKNVAITSILGVIFTVIFMVLYNYFINLSLIYNMKMDFMTVLSIFGLFNAIKWSAVSVVVILLYSKVNNLKSFFANLN